MKLRAYIVALHAALFAILLAATPAGSGSMTLMGAGKAPGAAGGGTVLFDAVASNSVANNAGTTLTWTHTPVGTPTAVAVVLENYDGGATITSVTYGSCTTTQAISQTTGTSAVKIYGCPNPPSGAQTVTITWAAAGAYAQAASITVTGSNITTAFDATNSATGTGTSPSVAVTSATGEFVVDVVGTTASATETQGGSQALRWGPLTVATNVASGSSLAAAAGSTTMSWTLGSSVAWAHAAASFKN